MQPARVICAFNSDRPVLKGIFSAALPSLALFAMLAWSVLEAAETPTGKESFERVCARCHGPAAEGAEGPALVPMYLTRDDVLAVVRGGQAKMPAVPAAKISDEEITAIVDYLNSLGQ